MVQKCRHQHSTAWLGRREGDKPTDLIALPSSNVHLAPPPAKPKQKLKGNEPVDTSITFSPLWGTEKGRGGEQRRDLEGTQGATSKQSKAQKCGGAFAGLGE